MSKEARLKATAHLGEEAVLDATELSNRGVDEEDVPVLLRGASCISEKELYERLLLLEDERRNKDRQ